MVERLPVKISGIAVIINIMAEKLKPALRSFQKKFWEENLGITVKPYSNRAIPWEPCFILTRAP